MFNTLARLMHPEAWSESPVFIGITPDLKNKRVRFKLENLQSTNTQSKWATLQQNYVLLRLANHHLLCFDASDRLLRLTTQL